MRSRFVRRVDRGAFPEDEYGAQFLSWGERGIVLACRVPAGGSGPAHHRHELSDQLYHVLEGELHVQLGIEVLAAPAGTTVFIPRGLPHHNWNPGTEPSLHLEVLAPAPRPDLPLGVAAAEDEAGSGHLVIDSDSVEREEPLTGFGVRRILERSHGSTNVSLYLADVAPGGGGPPTHIHRFDQFYFVVAGEMQVEVGLDRFVAHPDDLVVLPEMVPHRQYNVGDFTERHLTLLVPEPASDAPLDVPVDIYAREGI